MAEVIKIVDQLELVETKKFKHAHWPFEKFNPVQSRVFEYFEGDANFAIAAATSAGKTVVCEMMASYEVRKRKGKAVYIGPLKALAKEKEGEWTDPNHHFGDLNVSICTGDYRLTQARVKELDDADVIVMTPEMLASYTYDTQVYCHKNGSVWLEKIGRIVEENIDCEVMSYHKGFGIRPTVITGREKIAPKQVFRVEIAGGRHVEMTADHNLMIKDGGELVEKKLKEVKVGDRVAISNGFISPSDKSCIDVLGIMRGLVEKRKKTIFVYGPIVDVLLDLPTIELIKYCPLNTPRDAILTGTSRRRKAWKRRQCLPLYRLTDKFWNNDEFVSLINEIGLYHSSNRLPAILNVDDDLAWVIGFYGAEGNVSQNHVMIHQKDAHPTLEMCQSVLGGEIREQHKICSFRHVPTVMHYLDVSSVLWTHIFVEFGPEATVKKIPDFVFSWRSDQITAFLDGYLEGDGSVTNVKGYNLIRYDRTRYHTSSLEMSEDLQNLMLLTGKQSTRSKEDQYGSMYSVVEWQDKEPNNGMFDNKFPDLAFSPIRSIEAIGVMDVYDLEVQPEGLDYKVENWVGGQGGIILHNSRCRNSISEKSQFLQKTGTIAFDESHLLTVPSRGDHIEVALMKMVEINPDVRIIFLSATMPNVDEICEWLCKLTGRDTYYLESTYRPCPLNIHYETYYDGEKNYTLNEESKVGTALGLIDYYPDDKFLVFVHTKATGKMIVEHLKRRKIEAEFHNADLALKDRLKLEERFKTDKKFRIVVATSTLAWGCYDENSLLLGPNGRGVRVRSVCEGDLLLCPIGGYAYEEKMVERIQTFQGNGLYFTLENGQKMTVTYGHAFLTMSSYSKPNWKQANELVVGNYVACPSNLNLWPRPAINQEWLQRGLSAADAAIPNDVYGDQEKVFSFLEGRIQSPASLDILERMHYLYLGFGVRTEIRDGRLIKMDSDLDVKTDKCDVPLHFAKITEIESVKDVTFREIQVESPHLYVGAGAFSHNCNLPARRVIITGVHRGLSEVENYDIQQMIGRAGRPAYDPVGDAYILVPESAAKETIAKVQKKTPILSQLLKDEGGHYKTLAFHIVSEIYHGNVVTKEGFHDWFHKSLAHFQNQQFDDDLIDSVIDSLVKCYAVFVDETTGEYRTTPVGKIATIFYYSPFDVSDFRRNFKHLFEGHQHEKDISVALALANVDSHRWGICNRNEREQMATFKKKIEIDYGYAKYTDSVIKTSYAYYNMLCGKFDVPAIAVLQAGLRIDCERMMQVLIALDSMSGRWGKAEYFKTLKQRLIYGVEPHLISLCNIADIGRVRAERLWKAGIKNSDDFLSTPPEVLVSITKMKPAQIEASRESAKVLQTKKLLE